MTKVDNPGVFHIYNNVRVLHSLQKKIIHVKWHEKWVFVRVTANCTVYAQQQTANIEDNALIVELMVLIKHNTFCILIKSNLI